MTERQIDGQIDGLLDGLIGQFASPYDFLRELVQNAMDAGSDLVEVSLQMHRGDADDVVFELSCIDAGEGMDEAIIDGELTRLFSTSKTGDRTMAGGFGIGFVSVFAWHPEVVLLQTGRSGEAWELVFGRDRRFEKHRLDVPFEGTTLSMFRRGVAAQRPAIAEAIRDSLWRWSRFCPIEVTFEDVEGDRGLELIQDAPTSDDAAVALEHVEGQTRVRVAFAVPPRAVLLRHGLVLADGTPREVLPDLAESWGSTVEHIRVWADSPRLRPTLARDRVVDDDGRAWIERGLKSRLDELRERLLEDVEAAAAHPGTWGPEHQARFSHLHAHLALESAHLKTRLRSSPILRRVGGRPASVDGVAGVAHTGVVGIVQAHEAVGPEAGPLVVGALRAGVVVLLGNWADDRSWLPPLLARRELVARPLTEVVSRVRPQPQAGSSKLATALLGVLARSEQPRSAVRWGAFVDATRAPLWAVGEGEGQAVPDVVVFGEGLRDDYARGKTLWLDPRHDLVQRALRIHADSPRLAVAALALAVTGTDVSDAVDAVVAEAE